MMKRHFTLLTTVAALLILNASPLAQAQQQPQAQPLKVGVVVRVEAPDALDPGAIARNVLRQVEHALGDSKMLALVDQQLLKEAQERLDIRLGTDSTVRDLRAVSEVLHLDRLIIVYAQVSDRFEVELKAVVYSPRGDDVFLAAFNARGSDLNQVLERAVAGLLERLFPRLR